MTDPLNCKERISLTANRRGHFLKINVIEAPLCANEIDDIVPQSDKAPVVDELGKMLRQQWSIAFAKSATEPGQAAQGTAPHDRELQDQEELPITIAAKHNGRSRTTRRPEQPLSFRQPVEALERGAGDAALKCFPFRFDGGQ